MCKPCAKMNTKISEQVKRVAMEMYLNGVPIEEISRKLNLHKNSIHKWKRRGNWEARKEDLNKKVEKNVEVMAKEVLERLLKLSKAIQGKFVQTLDFQEIKPGDAIRAMELEAKLLGLFDHEREQPSVIGRLNVQDILEIAEEEMNTNNEKKEVEKRESSKN